MSCSTERPDIDIEENEDTQQEENQELLKNDTLSRRDIRSIIFHLLYAMEAFDYTASLEAVADNFNRGFNMELQYDSELFKTTKDIIDRQDELDAAYKPLLANWRLDRISVSTKLVLRLAVWELIHTDLDARIVINEAVELAKCFAEKDAFKFINGVLDGLAKQLGKKTSIAPESVETAETVEPEKK